MRIDSGLICLFIYFLTQEWQDSDFDFDYDHLFEKPNQTKKKEKKENNK